MLGSIGLELAQTFVGKEIARDPEKGLILGVYDNNTRENESINFTSAGYKFDRDSESALSKLLEGRQMKKGTSIVFNNVGDGPITAVCVVGLGDEFAPTFDCGEQLNLMKENVRVAIAQGVKTLEKMRLPLLMIDGCKSAEAAAEGALLALWKYKEFQKDSDKTPDICLYEHHDTDGWKCGLLKADAQNLARRLEEAPPNVMTPTALADCASKLLCPCGVKVFVREKDWLLKNRMNAFLSVAKGSVEPPLLLELHYQGGKQEEKPVAFVGKGVTFNSGGVCLRSCSSQQDQKADMAGAAVVVALLRAAALAKCPMNLSALVPLYEDMPGGMAMKPGDVVLSLNGTTIRTEDTSLDSRIALADSLSYLFNFNPCLVVNIAILTEGMRVAMGGSCTGVFCTSDPVWEELRKAGSETGDRVWRFPIWDFFRKQYNKYLGADVNIVGTGHKAGGDPCLGAAFLMEFAPKVDFLHLDISGTGKESRGLDCPYLEERVMTGRPTRTLIQFLQYLAFPDHEELELK